MHARARLGKRLGLGLLGSLCALIGALGWAGPALAVTYAPVNTPGPPLSVPVSQLRAALVCTASVSHARRAPVLLVPGTTLNPSEFAWNWEPALTHAGIPYCTIDLPNNGMSDIQTAGEYIVYSIRTMYREAGRKIDIVGHSQGGMVPRWALRFWPDTRTMVSDVIGLSPSNHGTIDANAVCTLGCAPAIWQQAIGSHFLAALNSYQETFAGISYTNIYTDTDEVVVPNIGPHPSSALTTGDGQITNVAIQQVCPNDVSEHLGIGTYDATAYAIALEALTHPGPADPALVPTSVCLDPLMPGVDPLTFPVNFAKLTLGVAQTLATYPHVSAEPPLACYVTVSCPGDRAASTPARTRTEAKRSRATPGSRTRRHRS
jgi:triacylglycerol esterase/lipase EstA (alpha/beta hydrolase family)